MKKLYVSMTSWTKRINYTAKLVNNMLNQTKKPDKIFLTLSIEEFPNKEKDLPNDLIQLLNNITLIWVNDNSKSFKKEFPILENLYNSKEECYVCIVDEDFVYNEKYLEILYNIAETAYCQYITPGTYGLQPHGYAMLYDMSWFNEKNAKYLKLSLEQKKEILAEDDYLAAVLYKSNITPLVVPFLEKLYTSINLPDKLSSIYANPSHIIKRQKYLTQLLSLPNDFFKIFK